jgi:hypothetical protein
VETDETAYWDTSPQQEGWLPASEGVNPSTAFNAVSHDQGSLLYYPFVSLRCDSSHPWRFSAIQVQAYYFILELFICYASISKDNRCHENQQPE